MTRTVTVSGQGSARVVPDSAVIRVAAVHRAPTVGDAFAGVASAVAAVIETARSVLEESRIASRDLNVWPTSDNEGVTSGFQCSHSVEIRCPSLEVAGSLLGELVEAVGDRLQVENVSLEVSDDAAAQVEARETAYADAVSRATRLATLSGAGLGAVLAISEGGPPPQFARDYAMAASAKADFAPGERSLATSLSVTFELTDQQS